MTKSIMFTTCLVGIAMATDCSTGQTYDRDSMACRNIMSFALKLKDLRAYEVRWGHNESALGMCEGDCNKDTDCPEGSTCVQRSNGEPTAVEGCTSGDELQQLNTNYCSNPGNYKRCDGDYLWHCQNHGEDESSCLSDINCIFCTPRGCQLSEECRSFDGVYHRDYHRGSCPTNPTCNDIDNYGTAYSSCASGTTINADLTNTCATDSCDDADCCTGQFGLEKVGKSCFHGSRKHDWLDLEETVHWRTHMDWAKVTALCEDRPDCVGIIWRINPDGTSASGTYRLCFDQELKSSPDWNFIPYYRAYSAEYNKAVFIGPTLLLLALMLS